MTWDSTTFGEVFEIQLGKMLDKKKNIGDLRPYLANRDVRWGECDVSNLGEMRFTAKDRAKYELRPGDLLVCEGGEVGRTAIWKGEVSDCYYQKAIHRLRSNGAVEPRFVMHYMRWAADRNLFARLTSATSIAHLTKAKLQKLPLPLPPLAEQRRIAGILDAADALRATRRESIAELDTLMQSVFLDMFGDPVTNPMGWEIRRIGEVFDVARGGSPRPIQDYLTDSEDGLNWILIGDARDDSRYITSTSKRIKPEGLKKTRLVRAGDFLLTNSMSFGRPYILKTDGCIHDGWLVLSPRDARISRDYFYNLLSTRALHREFTKRAAGAVVKNLNTKLVKQVPVPLPPVDLQQRFSVVVDGMESQKTRMREHLAELDTLFASLQSRAFRGDL